MPITDTFLNSLWLLLMTQLEADVYRQGHRLTEESKVRFIDPTSSRKTLFPLHSLRVSLITCYTIDGEIPTPVLSKLLVCHSRLIMTMHYTRVSPVAMANKMQEAEALRAAISDEFMQQQGWVVMPTGQVKAMNGDEVYKRGYVNAVKKLLGRHG